MAETQTAPATIEVNDAIFCTHYKEVVRFLFPQSMFSYWVFVFWQCTECNFDGREENDSFFGVGFLHHYNTHAINVDDGGSADETIFVTRISL